MLYEECSFKEQQPVINNNHKIIFNARLYFILTLNSPEEMMNSLDVAVPALVNILQAHLKNLLFLQRTPTSDQLNNNHKIMFNVRL